MQTTACCCSCSSARPMPRVFQYAHDLIDRLTIEGAIGWSTKRSDEFGLPLVPNLAVARERGQHLFVSEILAPGLELFGRAARPLSKLRQGLAERVWIGIGNAGARERLLEDGTDGRCIRPVGAG